MTLIIAINAALCFGVILMVVAPLVWAIFTQHRDVQAVVAQRRRRAGVAKPAARRAPRPQFGPIVEPA